MNRDEAADCLEDVDREVRVGEVDEEATEDKA